MVARLLAGLCLFAACAPSGAFTPPGGILTRARGGPACARGAPRRAREANGGGAVGGSNSPIQHPRGRIFLLAGCQLVPARNKDDAAHAPPALACQKVAVLLLACYMYCWNGRCTTLRQTP